jgi:hypothetical protein
VFAAYGRALGPIDTGYTHTPDSTSLHVPSIGLIAPGDVVYYLAETTTHTRLEWVDALDRLEALVLPGRRRRTQEPSRRRPA